MPGHRKDPTYRSPLDIIRDSKNHFFLVHGASAHWLARAEQSIKAKFKPEGIDWQEIKATEKNSSAILSEMGMQMLGVSYRGLIIRNFGSFVDKRNFSRFFDDPYLVVIAITDKLEVKDKDGKVKTILESLEKRMEMVEAMSPVGVAQTTEMMASLCREYKVDMDDQVLKVFWKNSGYDWTWFENNIRRAAWLGKKTWEDKEVEELCGQLSRVMAARISGYLMQENYLAICDIITRPETAPEVPNVLYFLERELYRGIMIGTLLEEGVDEQTIRNRFSIGAHQWSKILSYDPKKCRKWYNVVTKTLAAHKRGVDEKWLSFLLMARLSQANITHAASAVKV